MTVPALTLVMTTIGQQRFTAAQAGEDIDLTIATVGLTEAAFAVAPTLTALPGEFRRLATVSGTALAEHIIHMVVRDDADLGYALRGFGLFLADGTLFAVYGQAAPIMAKSPLSSLLLALDIAFPASDVTQITFGDTNFLDPPATETARGIIEIATEQEVDAGEDADRAVTPKRLAGRMADLATSLLAAFADALADYVPLAQKAQPNGVATLDAAGRVPAAQLPATPIGAVMLWWGAAVPAGWAICDGQTVARSDGAGLVTTPDLRGRVAVGASPDHAPGDAFGAASRTLATEASTAGISPTMTYKTETAGGGTDRTVKTVDLIDSGHAHQLTVDVTQPSLALHYIMKV